MAGPDPGSGWRHDSGSTPTLPTEARNGKRVPQAAQWAPRVHGSSGTRDSGKKFIDKTGREGTGKRMAGAREGAAPGRRKQDKGAWGMPWLPEMTKDVVSCEKLRGGANDP